MDLTFLKKRVIPIVLILLVIVGVNLLTTDYVLTILNLVLIYFIGALGISVLMGMTGLMMLASAAFMGIGGFISANLALKFGVPVWLSIILAMILTGVIGAMIGSALVKLSGAFFAFATLGLSQIVAVFLTNYRPFTGGPDGLQRIPTLALFGFEFTTLTQWFNLLCVLCLVTALLVERIRNTKLGRSLEAIRDNDVAAQTLGINVYITKVYAFTIASVLAAFSGALIAHHNSVISASLFSQVTSFKWFMMVMVGGVNSTIGAFLGTLIFTIVPEALRFTRLYINVIYGVIIILMMIFLPDGLIGLVKDVWRKITVRRDKKGEAYANN
jgi:branched-chain amino acid transport system permease protein